MTVLRLIFYGLISLWLAGCASTPGGGNTAPPGANVDLSSIPPAVPKDEPLSEYGNPPSYTVFGETYYPMSEARARGFTQTGKASWYGRKFHGQRTSSGDTYNMFRMTAAHKTLPLPSYVQVTNLRNDKQVIVRVNDRGPFHGDRIIDLSYVAALKLGIVQNGTAKVRITTISAEKDDRKTHTTRTATADKAAGPISNASPSNNSSAAAASAMYLQVGAFSQRGNAVQMSGQLRHMGLSDVATTTTHSNGQTLYRVRVGPFSSTTSRRAVRRRLALQGIPVIPVRQRTVR